MWLYFACRRFLAMVEGSFRPRAQAFSWAANILPGRAHKRKASTGSLSSTIPPSLPRLFCLQASAGHTVALSWEFHHRNGPGGRAIASPHAVENGGYSGRQPSGLLQHTVTCSWLRDAARLADIRSVICIEASARKCLRFNQSETCSRQLVHFKQHRCV